MSSTIVGNLMGKPLRMSSREIAELTGKQHKHVLADIRKMLKELSVEEKGYANFSADPQNGQKYPTFNLDKELTYTLIAGYNVKLRNAIICRWMALEEEAAGAGFSIPTTFPEALRLAAEQAERVALLEPKAAALDAISRSSTDLGVRDAGRELEIGQKRLAAIMIARGWACREGYCKRLKPAHYGLWRGYVRLVSTQYTVKKTGEMRLIDVLVLTRKGLTRMAEILTTAGGKA